MGETRFSRCEHADINPKQCCDFVWLLRDILSLLTWQENCGRQICVRWAVNKEVKELFMHLVRKGWRKVHWWLNWNQSHAKLPAVDGSMKVFSVTAQDDHGLKEAVAESLVPQKGRKKYKSEENDEAVSYHTDWKLIWLKVIPHSGGTFLPFSTQTFAAGPTSPALGIHSQH